MSSSLFASSLPLFSFFLFPCSLLLFLHFHSVSSILSRLLFLLLFPFLLSFSSHLLIPFSSSHLFSSSILFFYSSRLLFHSLFSSLLLLLLLRLPRLSLTWGHRPSLAQAQTMAQHTGTADQFREYGGTQSREGNETNGVRTSARRGTTRRKRNKWSAYFCTEKVLHATTRRKKNKRSAYFCTEKVLDFVSLVGRNRTRQRHHEARKPHGAEDPGLAPLRGREHVRVQPQQRGVHHGSTGAQVLRSSR